MPINRQFFFDITRSHLFGGRLSSSQVSGMDAILDVWEADHDRKDDRWLAYMLATAFHETAMAMQPVTERGGAAYLTKNYDVTGDNPARAKKMGNTLPGDGPKYCGRGFVQLTWKCNYEAMGPVVGCDLAADPKGALDPAIAAQIMFYGMEHGSFSGKKLSDYFDPETADWVNARRIINGLDRAPLIAGYGRSFYAAISYTTA
jgi:hypothetical protein